MIRDLINKYKEDLEGLKDNPNYDWIQDFIYEVDGDYYVSSIQPKNRLSEEDHVIINNILSQIGFHRWNKNTIRFNISRFCKEYKKINKQ